MPSNYYWIIYVRMCLVNDGNGDDEKNEGRKKSIKQNVCVMEETRKKSGKNNEQINERKQVMSEMNEAIVI